MENPPLPRKLKIDLSELELALDTSNWEIGYFLDNETGAVIMVQENTFRDLENIYEEFETEQEDEELEEPIDLEEILDGMDLHDWERVILLEADRVKNELGERFVRVPVVDSHESFMDMVDFIATVPNAATRLRLEQSLRGKGAFRRFKDTLSNFPVERERWFAFKKQRTQERIQDWLESIGIEAE